MCTYTLSDQPARGTVHRPRAAQNDLSRLTAAAGVGPAGRRHQRMPLWRTSAPGLHALTPAHIGARTDWARPAHICAGTRFNPPTTAPGRGLCPIQLRKPNQTIKQTNKQPRTRRNGHDGRRRPAAIRCHARCGGCAGVCAAAGERARAHAVRGPEPRGARRIRPFRCNAQAWCRCVQRCSALRTAGTAAA